MNKQFRNRLEAVIISHIIEHPDRSLAEIIQDVEAVLNAYVSACVLMDIEKGIKEVQEALKALEAADMHASDRLN